MQIYECTGTCCPHGRALPPMGVPIEVRGGTITPMALACFESSHGQARCELTATNGSAEEKSCILQCTKPISPLP
jgi:hypothetical protein